MGCSVFNHWVNHLFLGEIPMFFAEDPYAPHVEPAALAEPAPATRVPGGVWFC